MLKKLLAALGTLALVAGLVALVAGPASAHNHTVSASCAAGVSVDLTYYATGDATKHNTVSVWIDGVQVTDNPSFGGSFSQVYPFSTGQASHSYRVKVTAYDDAQYSFDTGVVTVSGCETEVTPAAATSTDPYCTAAGAVGGGGYTIPTQQSGVQYQLWNAGTSTWSNVGAGTYGANPGALIKIKAIPTTGYKFKQGVATSWTFTLSSPDASKCLVPVAPTHDASECTATPGSSTTATYTIPNAPAGYSYFLQGSGTPLSAGAVEVTTFPTTIVIVAIADSGYTFPSGTTSTWTFTFSSPGDCHLDVTPAAVVSNPAECTAPGVSSDNGFTITATPGVIYHLANDATPLAPGFHSLGSVAGSVEIQASAEAHYVLTGTIDWKFDFVAAQECLIKADFIVPTTTSQSCSAADVLTPASITIPSIADTPHVTYFIDGIAAAPGIHVLKPKAYLVSVEAEPGYFLQGYNGPWTDVLGSAEPCGDLITHPLVDPSAVQVQMACFGDGSYTLSNNLSDAAALVWTVNGATRSQGTYNVSNPGAVVVHAAVSGPSYGLEDGATVDWTFHFVRPTRCDLTTLALTGSTPTGWIVLGYLLLVSGLTLAAVRFARRRPSEM